MLCTKATKAALRMYSSLVTIKNLTNPSLKFGIFRSGMKQRQKTTLLSNRDVTKNL